MLRTSDFDQTYDWSRPTSAPEYDTTTCLEGESGRYIHLCAMAKIRSFETPPLMHIIFFINGCRLSPTPFPANKFSLSRQQRNQMHIFSPLQDWLAIMMTITMTHPSFRTRLSATIKSHLLQALSNTKSTLLLVPSNWTPFGPTASVAGPQSSMFRSQCQTLSTGTRRALEDVTKRPALIRTTFLPLLAKIILTRTEPRSSSANGSDSPMNTGPSPGNPRWRFERLLQAPTLSGTIKGMRHCRDGCSMV